MTKTGCKAAILIVLALLVLGGQVFAGPGSHGRGGRAGHGFGRGMHGGPGMAGRRGGGDGHMMFKRILRRLDPNDKQTEQIKAIREANKEKLEAAKKAIAEARKALHEAVIEGANEATVRAAATTLGNALGDQAVLKASTMASIKKILTEEQLAKLKEIRAKMKERAEKFREKMEDPEFRGKKFRHHRGPWHKRGDDRRGHTRGLKIDRLFETKDTNQDGKLTKEEFRAGEGQERSFRGKRVFEKADTDGDGALTVAELKAFKEKMKDRPRRSKGPGHRR